VRPAFGRAAENVLAALLFVSRGERSPLGIVSATADAGADPLVKIAALSRRHSRPADPFQQRSRLTAKKSERGPGCFNFCTLAAR